MYSFVTFIYYMSKNSFLPEVTFKKTVKVSGYILINDLIGVVRF